MTALSLAASGEVLRENPRESSAILPGLLASLAIHAAALAAQVELPGLFARSDQAFAPPTRIEAVLRRAAPALPPVAPSHPRVPEPPPLLQHRILTRAQVAPESAPEVAPRAIADPDLDRELHPNPEPAPEPDAEPTAVPEQVAARAENRAAKVGPEVLPAIEAPRFDAAYLDNPRPAYPLMARRRGQQGEVLLEVAVGADGSATRTEVLRSSGFSLLDSAARRAVSGWRFVPARRGAAAVEATVRVPIRFRLDDPTG